MSDNKTIECEEVRLYAENEALKMRVADLESIWSDPAKLHVNLLRSGYDRMSALHLAGCTDYDNIKAECDSKQATIDRLMLEYCPSEMSVNQIVEWSNAQKKSDIGITTSIEIPNFLKMQVDIFGDKK